MATASSPTVWRRWLALELRRLREQRRLSQRDVGRACGWSGARLSYLENAQQNVVEEDLDALLPLYEVPDSEQAWYYQAAERSHEHGWWERSEAARSFADLFSAFVGLEQGASEDRTFEPLVIPGLLQTPDYAAAVLAADVVPRTSQQVKRLVDLRMIRQEAIDRTENPLHLSAIVDESALRRRTPDATTMRVQLDHLVAMAERPNVTIQVVPFSRGVHPYTFGPFHLLSFPYAGDPGVVWLEQREGLSILEDQHHVESYSLVFQHLSSQLALSSDETTALIRRVAKELRD